MVRKKIKDTIRKNNLINAGEHIVIGLSGGPDSVCLFSVLNELKEEMGITLHAVHVNHGFRPGDAEEDQAYVENMCSELGVSCTSFVYDCNAVAAEEGLSSEEAGRKVRYDSFLKTAARLIKEGIPEEKIKIAVAQNADDQAETVLFRILRGTGTDGLAGIAYSRMEKNIMVIRPLLDTWRKDIEAYCSEHSLQPCIDHTNLQPVYTRNKIRLELIPYLQENFNENILEILGRLSRITGEDKEYLWQCAEEAYAGAQVSHGTLDQKQLAGMAPAIRHRVIMKALKEQGMDQDLTAAHLEAIDNILGTADGSRTVELPDGYRVSVHYGETAFYRVDNESTEGADRHKNAVLYAKVLSKAEYTAYHNGSVSSPGKDGETIPGAGGLTAVFDADRITEAHGATEIVLRTRMEGDFLAIKGGRKKIQDLFVDMKVPKEHRDSVLMAAAGSEILWLPVQKKKGVEKARYSYMYKLEQDTKNVVMLEFICEI